jgi:hypothetical protein
MLILFFAVVGVAVSRFIGTELGFLALLRVASFALGTSIMADTCVQIFIVDIPFWRFFRELLAAFYVAFGVGANLSKAGSTTEISYKDIRRRGSIPTDDADVGADNPQGQ